VLAQDEPRNHPTAARNCARVEKHRGEPRPEDRRTARFATTAASRMVLIRPAIDGRSAPVRGTRKPDTTAAQLLDPAGTQRRGSPKYLDVAGSWDPRRRPPF
jgi:hypothetical protein